MAEKRCVYKCGAWNCGSYQFNLYKDEIYQGDLCDVHYWQTKAQRPWQGLTDEEVQFYIEKHSKLVNAGYDKPTDTNVVTEAFDSTGFYKEVSAVLKERNT